jgi:hypothetical protein
MVSDCNNRRERDGLSSMTATAAVAVTTKHHRQQGAIAIVFTSMVFHASVNVLVSRISDAAALVSSVSTANDTCSAATPLPQQLQRLLPKHKNK